MGHAAAGPSSSVCQPQGSPGHTRVRVTTRLGKYPQRCLSPFLFFPWHSSICFLMNIRLAHPPGHGFLLPTSQQSPTCSISPRSLHQGGLLSTSVRLQMAPKSLHLLSPSPCQDARLLSAVMARATAGSPLPDLDHQASKSFLSHRFP